MNFLNACIAIVLFALPALAQEHHHEHNLPPGGRRALHGMVIYGSGTHFLDHIPMEQAPHDFQIVAEIQLQDQSGNEIKKNFSSQGFSFKPATNFSLNDYVSGRLTTFEGAIHQGSFEQDGPVVPGFARVRVVVKKFVLARQIPSASQNESLEVSDGTETFKINIITPARRIQKIENMTLGQELWCVKGPDFFEDCD